MEQRDSPAGTRAPFALVPALVYDPINPSKIRHRCLHVASSLLPRVRCGRGGHEDISQYLPAICDDKPVLKLCMKDYRLFLDVLVIHQVAVEN